MNLLVRHVLCALMPATATMPGMEDADVDAFIVRFRKDSAPLLWTGVIAGSVLFMLTPILTVGLPVPSFMLTKGLLDTHAAKITCHPAYLLRQGVFVARLAAGLCWGGNSKVRERLGVPAYDADPGTFRTS
jgi:hypothetical protein